MQGKVWKSAASALMSGVLSLLAACGGGGSDAPASVAAAVPVAGVSTVSPACTGCGATSATQYAGTGVGVWSASNAGTSVQHAAVSLAGLAGQNVRVVYSNPSANTIALSSDNFPATASLSTISRAAIAASASTPQTPIQAIQEFNRSGFAALLSPRLSAVARAAGASAQAATASAVNYNIGDSRDWYHMDGTTRTTRLAAVATVPNGPRVNVWVEASEYDPAKVSDAIVNTLLTAYARSGGVYDMLVSVGGPVWGAAPYSNIIGASQPVDLVVINFNHDNAAYGTIGYFWSQNNLTKASAPNSNESLALFLDSETMYLGAAAGMRTIVTTMAHESMHMQNFYRRGLLAGANYTFSTWLEEQTAMMMEDWASYTLDPAYNNVRDTRVRDFVAGAASGCSLVNFYGAGCDGYAVNGAFGGFLNRQLGLAFFRDLLYRTDSTDSATVLNEAIRAANASSSLADQAERFGVTMGSLIPASIAPAGYGFPARSEGGFALAQIDVSNYTAPSASTVSATALNALASAPLLRASKVQGTYSETLPIPAGATLAVVVF